jgi:hypothetical protein
MIEKMRDIGHYCYRTICYIWMAKGKASQRRTAMPEKIKELSSSSRRNWILAVIAAAEGESISPVQLQKSLFLVGEKLRKNVGRDFYEFVPYHYGPFSSDIYDDALILADEGLLKIRRSPNGKWTTYSITAKGKKQAKLVADNLPEKASTYIRRLMQWVVGLTFRQLVSSIYQEYPEYRQNSVFIG